ncbi:MAG: four helix bundle suffix domain-containing protein [Kiritimatiellia bacterium]
MSNGRPSTNCRRRCCGKRLQGGFGNVEQVGPRQFQKASAEVAANTMIGLINQATYLLGRQPEKLQQTFLEEGGFAERLYRERKRKLSDGLDRSDESDKSATSDKR